MAYGKCLSPTRLHMGIHDAMPVATCDLARHEIGFLGRTHPILVANASLHVELQESPSWNKEKTPDTEKCWVYTAKPQRSGESNQSQSNQIIH